MFEDDMSVCVHLCVNYVKVQQHYLCVLYGLIHIILIHSRSEYICIFINSLFNFVLMFYFFNQSNFDFECLLFGICVIVFDLLVVV